MITQHGNSMGYDSSSGRNQSRDLASSRPTLATGSSRAVVMAMVA